MATLPDNPRPTLDAIHAAYVRRNDAQSRRGHLGASVLGKPCERDLWYGFRWAFKPEFPGRVLRLFERGHREEDWLAADLRATGATVHTLDPRTGQQFRFSILGGHVGGSMDAAMVGMLEAPKAWHVVEFKTHGDKSFRDLTSKGVEGSKPEHYAQMQLYMRWSGMERAAYVAVNKNDDAIHIERVRIDKAAGERLEARATRIVQSAVPLARISDDPAWYQCRFCPAHDICHGDKLPDVNCRTCVHATPEIDDGETWARWSCALHKRDLTPDEQAVGCPSHRYIPALVSFAEQVDANAAENWIEYRLPNGRIFWNGCPAPGSYTSAELQAMHPSMIGDPGADTIRETFDARHANPLTKPALFA